MWDQERDNRPGDYDKGLCVNALWLVVGGGTGPAVLKTGAIWRSSFAPQRHRRIDVRRPTSGKQAGEHADRGECGNRQRDRDRVVR